MKGSSILYIFLGVVLGSVVGGYALAEEFEINLMESISLNSGNSTNFNSTIPINEPVKEPIMEPVKKPEIKFKDCSIYEKLKKEWFACEQFNQDIASDKLTDKRVEQGKEISRGF